MADAPLSSKMTGNAEAVRLALPPLDLHRLPARYSGSFVTNPQVQQNEKDRTEFVSAHQLFKPLTFIAWLSHYARLINVSASVATNDFLVYLAKQHPPSKVE